MKDRKIPMRRCVGCMTSREKQELVRIAGFESRISVDTTGKAKGRGAYLCRNNPDCWEKAYKRKALERSLGMEITPDAKESIFAELKEMSRNREMSDV
ncbi:MAG: YlxR family protein [Firmicutes bacterium]|nr:YlxR family protein [Bacillota bacterium]